MWPYRVRACVSLVLIVNVCSVRILRELLQDLMAGQREAGISGFRHVLGARLRVGWGTLRVALGMATGQHVYRLTREFIDG